MNFNAEVFQATQDIQVNQAGQAIHIIQASQATQAHFLHFQKCYQKFFNIIFSFI